MLDDLPIGYTREYELVSNMQEPESDGEIFEADTLYPIESTIYESESEYSYGDSSCDDDCSCNPVVDGCNCDKDDDYESEDDQQDCFDENDMFDFD